MTHRAGSTIALLAALLTLGRPSRAQGQRITGPDPESCTPRRPSVAVGQALGVNLLVNRLDAWAFGQETQRVNVESWSRNIRLGWEWDENSFATNMLTHPIHGNTYFNAGRANCLTFWESVPLAFLGSWTWEYFGETNRPSLNDFFFTSLGGIALGEMTHRVAMTIRDEEATGTDRVLREVLATLVSPVAGVNRLFRGQWKGVRPNPPGHRPGPLAIALKVGPRAVTADSSDLGAPCREGCGALAIDFDYGNPLDSTYHRPFDVFSVHLEVSPGGGGLTALEGVGRLYQTELNRNRRRWRHSLSVTQRYAYNSYSPLVSYGAQSIEVGVLSRWPLSARWHLHTRLAADAVIMGAVSDEQVNVVDRTYDFGPGGGLGFDISLWRDRTRYLVLTNRGEYLHTVSGVTSNHVMSFSRLEVNVPLGRRAGVGLASDFATRTTARGGTVEETRQFGSVRAFFTWNLQ